MYHTHHAFKIHEAQQGALAIVSMAMNYLVVLLSGQGEYQHTSAAMSPQ